MKRRCTNDSSTKAAEVADGMKRFGNYPGMTDLYKRGCFRHLEDVAFGRIMLEKHTMNVDAVASQLDSSYEGPKRDVKHRCDRVFPPS
jgi:hypothetical protein